MNYPEVNEVFFSECEELLQEIESVLLHLLEGIEDKETINKLFRHIHTIKGSAGIFGFEHIEAFAHGLENLLQQVREEKLHFTPQLAEYLLKCRDHLAQLVECAAANSIPDQDLLEQGEALTAGIREFMPAGNGQIDSPPTKRSAAIAPIPETDREEDTWHLSLRFKPDTFRNGFDPLSFIRYLNEIGRIVELRVIDRDLPPLTELDPENCHLGFEIRLRTPADEGEIRQVFEFVEDDCDITVAPEGGRSQPAPAARVAVGVTPATTARSEERLPLPTARKARKAKYIRVDSDKLDQLVNFVGELVISTAHICQTAHGRGYEDIAESTDTLTKLVGDIRDSTLQLRMIPIGGAFNRFNRIVHDLGQELGKEVRLEIHGAETELDKSVTEIISDPLMHLVRNAIDHGLETSERRAALGKNPEGTLRLNAYHETGEIIIEVGDDGAGLNREKILARAMKAGLVKAGETLTDTDIHRFLFMPGFSTAEHVTNLSGRGVGLDVVNKNIEALRGRVDIESQEGRGTTMRIRLPLTLAIIDGFLVNVAESSFIIPLDLVVECLQFSEEYLVHGNKKVMELRGEALPVIRLGEIFDVNGKKIERENIVVVRQAGKKIGLIVDELLGEVQSVIKPLGRIFGRTPGFSGATILGDGTVALILDVASLVGTMEKREKAEHKKRKKQISEPTPQHEIGPEAGSDDETEGQGHD